MNDFSRLLKTRKRVALIIALIAIFSLCLACAAACQEIYLVKITADYSGDDVVAGGTLDESKVTVTAHFSDNTSKIVTPSKFDYDFTNAGRRLVEITYSYSGKEVKCLLGVTVVDPEPSVTLTSITATYYGSVEVGAQLGNGLAVMAHYSNGKSDTVHGYQVGALDTSSAGQKTLTITYTEGGVTKTCTVIITVVEPEPPKPAITLASITAVYNGENIKVGGTLDKEDIVVTAHYSNEATKTVTDFAVTGFSSSTAGDKEVTITYVENDVTKTCTVIITVVEPEPPKPAITLESITAVYNGESIKVGGTLNKEDIVVTAHYSNEATKTVTDFTVTGFSLSTAGDKEVTITYVEDDVTKTCTVTITVVEPEPPKPAITLESITAVYNGESIKVGGTLDSEDIVVTAHYSNEATKTVTDFTVTGFSLSTAGDKEVTITYVEDDVTKTCTVTITVVEPKPPKPTITLESITAIYNGENIKVGGTLDSEDIAVTAHYSDNTTKPVTGFTVGELNSATAGDKEVTITYVENDVNKTCTVIITVVEPEPPKPAITLESITAVYNGESIKVGGTLDKEDIAVTAHYSNSTSNLVTVFTVTGFNSSTAGDKEVTITYVEDDVTKTCTVTITVVEPEPPKPAITLESITAVYNGENIKVGGVLNNDNIQVTAHYSNGSSNAVNNFSVGGFSSASAGTCAVTVSYTENGVTRETTINIVVVDDDVISNSNLSVHFLQFENQSSGDCVYIKAGETDILIDAGSTDGSASTIDKYLKNYVDDGKLEYVIATHAHTDHISAFVGTDSTPGIMDRYECETIIRYAQSTSTSQMRTKFEAKCSQQVAQGANLYTALDCVNNANGAQKLYDLTGDGSITMEVLNHKYYATKSSDENDHSVCVMITQGSNHYLFTGDLEESGEKSLVELNPNLPEMVLFKGGHHGSYTASNEVLLSKIKPQYVCICCCAGNVEYLKIAPQNLSHSFPAQEMIDRIAKYTDKVYVTTRGFIRWDESKNKYFNDGYEPMNGNIVFSCVNGNISLQCSNNNLKLKDTEWFKNNRTRPEEWKDKETGE